MRDPYEILGLASDSSEEELKARYEHLKKIYGDARFQSGEDGMKAARNLNELEEAWRDISDDLKSKTSTVDAEPKAKTDDAQSEQDNTTSEQDARVFAYVDELIRAKKYDDAQTALDNCMTRNAEWHYLQSRLFFYREWLMECQKHLELAIQMDPENSKYTNALNRLKQMMGNKNANPENLNNNMDGQGAQYQQQNVDAGSGLVNCCTTYCCMNMCLNMCCRCM